MPAQPGTEIAGYRIVSLLGSGGMGDVYVVENPQLQRREAMKVISVAGASNPDFQQRFANEARTAASLDHPSIITVHSYGVSDPDETATSGLPWFTMSYLEGPDLSATRLTPAETVDAITQVASALDYAHGRTVVHRDVKPANIVVTRDAQGRLARAVVLDFGIAKLSDSPHLTAMNSVVGTMAYTAPEIISGQPATGRSDQYSLACTVFDVLTGHAPFRADTATALMMAHVQQPPPPLAQERPDLAALGPVIARGMAKDPAARYPDCAAFAADLRRALGHTDAGTATAIASTPFPSPMHPSGQVPHSGPVPQPAAPAYLSGPNASNANQPHPAMSNPGMAGPGLSNPQHPGLPYTPQSAQPRKSKRALWISLAAAAVAIVAIGGTSPLWWPSKDAPAAPPSDSPLSVAFGTTCMVSDGDAYCWGSNDSGQIGDGTTTTRDTPTKVAGLGTVTSVSVGGFLADDNSTSSTTCAISDGDVYCWGANGNGQIGSGASDKGTHSSPSKVANLSDVTSVSTSYGGTCAVSAGDLYCWGYGNTGQIGNGTTASETLTPTKVTGLSDVRSVRMSAGTVCAITDVGELYCWGWNSTGQVGNGTTVQQNTPAKVGGLSDVTAVAIGMSRDKEKKMYVDTCAVAAGKLYCWGDGIGVDTERRSTPAEITGIDDVRSISTDVGTLCAVTGEGTLYCWGNNANGQLGIGSTERAGTPTRVSGLADVEAVGAGSSTTCALTADETYCWGGNFDSQIRPGSTDDKATTPVKIAF